MLPSAGNFYESQTGESLASVDRTPLAEGVNNYGVGGSAVFDALSFYNTVGGSVPDKAYRNVVESNLKKRERWEKLGLTPRNISRVAAVGGALALAGVGTAILAPDTLAGAVHLVNNHILGPVGDFLGKQAGKVGDTYKSEILNPLRDKVADVGLLQGNKGPVERATGVRGVFDKLANKAQGQYEGFKYTVENTVPGNLLDNRTAALGDYKKASERMGSVRDMVVGITDRNISKNTGPVFDMFRGVLKFFGTGNEKATKFAIDGTNAIGKAVTPFFGEKYLAGGTEYANAGKYSDIARYAGIGAGIGGAGLLLKPFRRIGDTYRMIFPTRSAGPLRLADERNINEKMNYASERDKDSLRLAKMGLKSRENALAATANNFTLMQSTRPSFEGAIENIAQAA